MSPSPIFYGPSQSTPTQAMDGLPFVLQQTGNASEDATFVFDKQLDNGMYMLNITAADGQTFTRRVVIAN